MSDFERLGVCDEICQALDNLGWTLATAVQDEAIPLVLTGGDVCVAAETGSGKTGAFGVPALQLVVESLKGIAEVPRAEPEPAAQNSFFTCTKPGSCEVSSDGSVIGVFNRWVGAAAPSLKVERGKYQFEVEVIDGACRVGWSSPKTDVVGCDSVSFGYGVTGKKSFNNTYDDYGPPYGKGDIIGCLLDLEERVITFVKNGEVLPVAFSMGPTGNPSVPMVPAVAGRQFRLRVNVGPELQYPIGGFLPVGNVTPTASPSGACSDSCPGSPPQTNATGPLCIILEPTKDLAQQTYDALISYGTLLGPAMPRVGLFVAGYDENQQRELLRQGVHIAVGTLSRIYGYVQRRQLPLTSVRVWVLDEADALLNNDEKRELPALRRKLPAAVQSLFFSATLHGDKVKQAIAHLCKQPTWVDLKGKPTVPSCVHCVAYVVDGAEGSAKGGGPAFKPPGGLLPPTDGVHMLGGGRAWSDEETASEKVKLLKPQAAVAIADKLDMKSCLVFCRTNLDCDNFERYLVALGGGKRVTGRVEAGVESRYSCVVLAGMRDPTERRLNLELFREGRARFLVCTDVAARGIDVKGLPFMIMLTLPDDVDQFFHRVGRVGRAEAMGLAICVVANCREKVWYHRCRDRGRNCSNRKEVSQGGCCIWLDEPKMLTAIEERVGAPLRLMDRATFSVSGIIEFNEKSAKAVEIYGKSQQGSVLTTKHVKDLEGAVSRCREIDIAVQRNFVQLFSRGLHR